MKSKTAKPAPSATERRRYQLALETIAPWWYSGASQKRMPMPDDVRLAYRIVGRFTARWHSPPKGTPHPAKSSRHRLKSFDLASLPPAYQVVSKTVRAGPRSWQSVWLESRDPIAGIVTSPQRQTHFPLDDNYTSLVGGVAAEGV